MTEFRCKACGQPVVGVQCAKCGWNRVMFESDGGFWWLNGGQLNERGTWDKPRWTKVEGLLLVWDDVQVQ